MAGKNTIRNKKEGTAIVDIEGVIGVPEEWQFDEVDDRVATYEGFRKQLGELESLEAEQVMVNIRSMGGDVNDALLIMDALKGLEAVVTTRCYGYVASAATIIAQAATEGRREISANSLYLIHKSVCAAEGNSQELTKSLDLLDKSDQRIAAIYAERSGKEQSLYEELMGENSGSGRWLSPDEVLEYGLADKIVESEPIAKNLANEVKNFGLPPLPERPKNLSEKMAKRWKALLELLGLVEDSSESEFLESSESKFSESEFSENEFLESSESGESEKVKESGKVEERPLEKTRTKAEAEQRAANYEQEVERLKNHIALLESKNARLSIRATKTVAKEDPSPQEQKYTANESAYIEDVRGFL